MGHVKAPWSDEQVDKLNEWQAGMIKINMLDGSMILMQTHPFTCGAVTCDRSAREDEGKLIPSNNGWVCPCGDYKQDWCHDFMLGSQPEPAGKSLSKYTIDLAKLAIEKGYPNREDLLNLPPVWCLDEFAFSTIIFGFIQTWLRREHRVVVWVEPIVPFRFVGFIDCDKYTWNSIHNPGEWELAMIKGLTHALENL